MADEESKTAGNSIAKIRKNPWILATIFLVVVLFVVLVVRPGSTTGNVVSEDVAAQKLADFAKTQGISLEDITTEDMGSFYQISFSIDGSQSTAYITKDGGYIIQPVSPLTAKATDSSDKETGTSEPVNIPIGNSPVLGNANAKLTIVEFSDFSCPYCGAASGQSKDYVDAMKSKYSGWEPAIPGIIRDYVNTGKAKLVYKYSMGHSGGHPATLVGFCLNDQNLFWEFHDKAFAAQADVENLDKMRAIAQSLGADMTKLNACLDSKKYDSKLDDDESLGQSIGLSGTPAIYANGILVAHGAESYSDVKKAIDAVLAQAA